MKVARPAWTPWPAWWASCNIIRRRWQAILHEIFSALKPRQRSKYLTETAHIPAPPPPGADHDNGETSSTQRSLSLKLLTRASILVGQTYVKLKGRRA